jgi:hypothetical protein
MSADASDPGAEKRAEHGTVVLDPDTTLAWSYGTRPPADAWRHRPVTLAS